MDWNQIALAATGLFLAGFVKGATGLGYSTCALPFLVAAIGLRSAIVIVPIPAMAANIGLLFGAGHIKETLQRFWIFYAATIPGIFYGTRLLGSIDQQSATRVLGLITVAYVIYGIIHPNFHLPEPSERRLQLPAGLLNGFLTGLTGSQIMPLLPFMVSLRLDPDRFVQAINVAVVTASLILILALFTGGLMTWPLLVLSILGVLPALLGVYIGNRMRSHIPLPRFRMVVLFMLLVMGFSFMANINSFFSSLAG